MEQVCSVAGTWPVSRKHFWILGGSMAVTRNVWIQEKKKKSQHKTQQWQHDRPPTHLHDNSVSEPRLWIIKETWLVMDCNKWYSSFNQGAWTSTGYLASKELGCRYATVTIPIISSYVWYSGRTDWATPLSLYVISVIEKLWFWFTLKTLTNANRLASKVGAAQKKKTHTVKRSVARNTCFEYTVFSTHTYSTQPILLLYPHARQFGRHTPMGIASTF